MQEKGFSSHQGGGKLTCAGQDVRSCSDRWRITQFSSDSVVLNDLVFHIHLQKVMSVESNMSIR